MTYFISRHLKDVSQLFFTCALPSCSIADTTTNDSVVLNLEINKRELPATVKPRGRLSYC